MLQFSFARGFMLLKTIVIESALLTIFIFLALNFLRDFGIKKEKVLIFIVPLLTFTIGFSLRLTHNQSLIDLGFFFTELSTIFVTILFTLCLYLGQVKYWRVGRK